MPEVRMTSARGNDEKIVMQRLAAVAEYDVLVGKDLARLGEQHLGVLLRAQQPSDRRGDVARRERRRGHLVEQRLKDVMVRAIDDGDVDGGIAQRPRGVQSAKST